MKQILKSSLVPLLASRQFSTIAEKFVRPGIPVFMLHRFLSADNPNRGHDPDFLNDCLKYLVRNNFNFVSLEQIIHALTNNSTLPDRSIAFTMDDGFEDQATIAAPVFLENNCPVTIFLISGMLDGELWPWDDQVAYLLHKTTKENFTLILSGHEKAFNICNKEKKQQVISEIQNWIKSLAAEKVNEYLKTLSNCVATKLPDTAPSTYKAMSWDQARQLEKQGIHFAPHTHSHRILSQLNNDNASKEIIHSWQRLSKELSSPTAIFCYPTGRAEDFSQREIDIIRKTGMIGAVSTEATYINPHIKHANYIYQLPRFSFPDSLADFQQYSSWIERAKSQLRK